MAIPNRPAKGEARKEMIPGKSKRRSNQVLSGIVKGVQDHGVGGSIQSRHEYNSKVGK